MCLNNYTFLLSVYGYSRLM